VYLFFAFFWVVVSLVILIFLPDVADIPFIAISPQLRMWAGGFAWVLAGWNIVRWRMARIRRQVDEEARQAYTPVRPRRHHEPPNPDFDFSDPKPGDRPPNPPGPRPPASS